MLLGGFDGYSLLPQFIKGTRRGEEEGTLGREREREGRAVVRARASERHRQTEPRNLLSEIGAPTRLA